MKELYILNRIKGEYSWMKDIFHANNKTMATNGYSLVVVPKLFEKFPDYSEKIKDIYPVPQNMDKLIKINELKEKLSLFPRVDYCEVEEECDACDGDGFVSYEFSHDMQIYHTESECPVCEGKGACLQAITQSKKVIDGTKLFKIGKHAFHVDRIEELIFIADTLKEDIKLVGQGEVNKPTLFRVGDIELLQMAVITNKPDNIIQIIS